MTKILYHPRFEPDKKWLRTMLLFYDTVHSIVPRDSGHKWSPDIEELQDRQDNAFVPLTPNDQDLEYEIDFDYYDEFHRVLCNLRRQNNGQDRDRMYHEKGIKFETGDAVLVHTEKMADRLLGDLIKLGLAKNEETKDPKWVRVDPRVASLVLSMLAGRMVMNRPDIAGSCSDQETAFAVTAGGNFQNTKASQKQATLAASVLKAHVPGDIADLPIDRYIDLRKRYEDKRDIFQRAIQELQMLCPESSFQGPDKFQGQLEAIVQKFDQGMKTLYDNRSTSRVNKWMPVAIGGILGLTAAATSNPTIAIGAASVSFAINLLKTAQGEKIEGTYISKSQSLLVKLGTDIDLDTNWLGRVFQLIKNDNSV